MRYLDLRKWSWILFASSALLLEVCEGGRGGEVCCWRGERWSFYRAFRKRLGLSLSLMCSSNGG